MMKKIATLLLIILLITLNGCAKEEKRAYLCTDLHYFSHDLHDDGPLFNRMLATITMLTEYTPEILDEFTQKAIDDHPDYLICVSHETHNAIHYGNESLLSKTPVERTRNDTCPWKK